MPRVCLGFVCKILKVELRRQELGLRIQGAHTSLSHERGCETPFNRADGKKEMFLESLGDEIKG